MKKAITALLLLTAAVALSAQETPRWIRKSAISPDGKTIAFSYQGDIFTVPAEGGVAKQLTTNPAQDSDPLWTADGKNIVFSSYRELSKDIWVMPAEGGKPTRLTTYNGNETPLATTKDGKVLFAASIQQDTQYDGFPEGNQLYSVDMNGKIERIFSLEATNVTVNADGLMLYEDKKGYEDNLRKHHTSSVTRDIWRYNPCNGEFYQLSRLPGENRNPQFAPDGHRYYFVAENGGNFNIYRSCICTPDYIEQVTSLPTHPVRNITISDTELLLFSYNGDLYTCYPCDDPQKVNITVYTDKTDRDVITRKVNNGATMAVSPNGKELALTAHGEVFVTSVEHKTTRRITDTPEQERGVSFGRDGKTLYYAAERDGEWAIWKSELPKGEKYFTYSYNLTESRVTEPGQTCFYPQVSPDGRYLAYLRDRTDIVIKDLDSTNVADKVLLEGVNYSYSDGDRGFEWSPDSRHILTDYMADGGWHNMDVAMIDIESGEITNLTRSGYADGGYRWILGGKAMIWCSDKMGYRSHGSWGTEDDIYAMFFDAKEYWKFIRSTEEDEMEKLLAPEPEKKPEAKPEEKPAADSTAKAEAKAAKPEAPKWTPTLDGREDRIVRLTQFSGRIGDCYLTNDGKFLYFTQYGANGPDLYKLDIKKRDLKPIEKGIAGAFYPDKEGKNLYMSTTRGLVKMNLATGKIDVISADFEFEWNAAKEREYIFNHAWKQVDEKFYDKDIHGVDWAAMHDNYAQFLPYINNNFDFQDLLSEMLGELNGSHTGGRYYYRSGLNTGHLGVMFDETDGDITIAEILPGSCLAIVDDSLKVGDKIIAVDGKLAKDGDHWYDLLSMKAGKRVPVTLKAANDSVRTIFVTPTSSDYDQMYKRWVRQREQMVAELSNGRVAYVHVEGMNSPSFREVFSNLLGKYRTCEAVIVDTRHNGGGWLHDDLCTLLSGKPVVEYRPRGQYIGTDPFNKWTKISCVLMGEDNYSDACGFPYEYRALGIGKLIGAPVPGTMTAVWWETQIDNTLVFGIPQVTAWGVAVDRPLENMQIEPDILIYNTPADYITGHDAQLEAAVNEMLRQLDEK